MNILVGPTHQPLYQLQPIMLLHDQGILAQMIFWQ